MRLVFPLLSVLCVVHDAPGLDPNGVGWPECLRTAARGSLKVETRVTGCFADATTTWDAAWEDADPSVVLNVQVEGNGVLAPRRTVSIDRATFDAVRVNIVDLLEAPDLTRSMSTTTYAARVTWRCPDGRKGVASQRADSNGIDLRTLAERHHEADGPPIIRSEPHVSPSAALDHLSFSLIY